MNNLFSMEGRLNRAGYWFIVAVYFILAVIVAGIVVETELEEFYGGIISIVLLFLLVYPATVKRLHDVDRPASHFWLLFVPIYNFYLSLVLLFEKGTNGPNKYGEDPLAKKDPLAHRIGKKYFKIKNLMKKQQ